MTLVEISERFGEVRNAGHIAHFNSFITLSLHTSEAEYDKSMTSFY